MDCAARYVKFGTPEQKLPNDHAADRYKRLYEMSAVFVDLCFKF